MVEQARARTTDDKEQKLGTPAQVQDLLKTIRDTVKIYTRPADDLATNGFARTLLTPTELRTEIATASAIRVVGERETSWTKGELIKTALDLGIKGVTAGGVEHRMGQLVSSGKMLEGKTDRLDKTVENLRPRNIATFETRSVTIWQAAKMPVQAWLQLAMRQDA